MPPTNPSSMRQAIRQRQQQTFVGRGVELDTFRQQLTLAADDPRRYFVLNVYGQGGVGKTTLLGAFARLGGGQGAAVALTDDSESDAPAAMARLAGQLADALPGGDPCHAFAERYRTYRQKRAELEADPDAPTGLAGLFGRAAVKVGAKALRNVAPGADLVLGYVEDPLAEQAGQWAEFVRRKLGNRDEAQLVLEPETVLTPLFVQGVRAVAAARPVALLFDTYERTAEFLDGWLRALLDFRHGDLPDNLTLVIAGRQPLDRNAWAALEGVIAPLCLEPFDEAEARDYLSRRGVVNEPVVDVILTLSGRLPLLLMLLASQSPDDPAQVGDTTGTAVERFLKWVVDPARRALALNGALPRWLNRDVAALLGGDDAFDWLVDNRLIERKGEGQAWTYHEVVREQMLRYKHAEAPAEWTARHERLAEHYAAARDGLGLSWAEGARNEAWRAAALEALYHRLCARPDKHLAEAVNEFVAALDLNQLLVLDPPEEWAHGHISTMEAAGRDTNHDGLLTWSQRLRTFWDDATETQGLVDIVTQLLEWSRLSKSNRPIILILRAVLSIEMEDPDVGVTHINEAIGLGATNPLVFALRAQLYRLGGKYTEALADFEKAVTVTAPELLPGVLFAHAKTYFEMGLLDEALPIFSYAIQLDPKYDYDLYYYRGETYQQMGEYAKALTDFDRAIEIDPEYARAIAHRGETYRQMGEYAKALADFDRAIEIDPKYTWAITNRGETYHLMGEYAKALADFDRAIEIDPKYAWALASRGETYRLIGEYAKALADFDRAIEIDPKLDWALASRGETYRLMGEYVKALADFDLAIEIDPKYTWAIASRGDTYRHMGEYDQALADFDRAIEINPNYAWAIAHRSETYRQMDEYDKALVGFDRAIEVDPKYAWAIASRGQVYRSTNRYDEALVDFSQALAIDSSLDWALIERGETYQLMGAYAQALVDLDKAIELDPKYAWAIAPRGETYRLIGEYEQAMADFDRAIEIDPNYAWAIARRGETYRLIGEYSKALADLDQAIELQPSGWKYYQRALTRCALDPTSDWKTDLERAIALAEEQHRADPTDLNNLFNLAVYRVTQGDEAAAEALYRECLAAGPTAPTLRDAIGDLDDYLRLFPDDEAAARLRALLAAAGGTAGEA